VVDVVRRGCGRLRGFGKIAIDCTTPSSLRSGGRCASPRRLFETLPRRAGAGQWLGVRPSREPDKNSEAPALIASDAKLCRSSAAEHDCVARLVGMRRRPVGPKRSRRRRRSRSGNLRRRPSAFHPPSGGARPYSRFVWPGSTIRGTQRTRRPCIPPELHRPRRTLCRKSGR